MHMNKGNYWMSVGKKVSTNDIITHDKRKSAPGVSIEVEELSVDGICEILLANVLTQINLIRNYINFTFR